MDTQTILSWQRTSVAKLIRDSGFTPSRVAIEASIPHTTFVRKLKGVTEFKPSELFRIAQVIHVDPALLVPPVFVHERAA